MKLRILEGKDYDGLIRFYIGCDGWTSRLRLYPADDIRGGDDVLEGHIHLLGDGVCVCVCVCKNAYQLFDIVHPNSPIFDARGFTILHGARELTLVAKTDRRCLPMEMDAAMVHWRVARGTCHPGDDSIKLD